MQVTTPLKRDAHNSSIRLCALCMENDMPLALMLQLEVVPNE